MKIAFFLCLSLPVLLVAQNKKIDSLEKALQSATTDSARIMLLAKLSDRYRSADLYDKAIARGQTGISLSLKSGFGAGLAHCYTSTGTAQRLKGDFKSALVYLEKGVQEWKTLCERKNNPDSLKHKRSLAAALSQIGIVYKSVSDYRKALDYYFRSLEICEKTRNKPGVASAFSNIAELYYNMGDQVKALEYQKKDLDMRAGMDDPAALANAYNNLGILYDQMQDSAARRAGLSVREKNLLAFQHNEKALKIRMEIGDSLGIAFSLGNIGMLYPKQDRKSFEQLGLNYGERYKLAIEKETAALNILQHLGSQPGVAMANLNLGSLHSEQNAFGPAIEFAERANQLAKEIGDVDTQKGAHFILYSVFKSQNNKSSALDHYEQYILLRDSIIREEDKQEATRKEMTYEFSKKEISFRAEQEKQKALAEEEKRRQRSVIYSVSGGLFLVLIFAGLLTRSLRSIKKKNIIISRQKAMVDEKQKELIDSIRYAQRIQKALLPSEKYIERNLRKMGE